MRLKNKVAIVTGGGTGIGKAMSLAFAAEGAAVVVAARTRSRLEAVVDEIRSKEGRATAIPIDVTNEDQVRKMVAQTLNEYGQIDILVNNSAMMGATAANVVDIKLDDWNKELAVNLTGAMLCARGVLRGMITRQSGNIINISSGSGKGGYPMRSSYCVSKWGIIGLTQTLALEVGGYNIRVNCIAPGWVEGERLESAMKGRAEATGLAYEEVYEQVVDGAIARAALGRIVSAAEVADAAVFLASDESSGLTGQTIGVDAGSRL